MADDDEGGRHRRLIREEFSRRSEELARKQEELDALLELGAEAGFTPRASLARTPPDSPALITMPTAVAGPSKRPLTSPEDVQEAVRRRTQLNKMSGVPPIGGILSSSQVTPKSGATVDLTGSQPVWRPADDASGLAAMNKIQLLDAVHTAVKGIAAVANAANKLNMADKGSISGHSQDILAVVSALELRLADAEHQVTALKLKCTTMELEAAIPRTTGNLPVKPMASQDSYAARLKLPKGKSEFTPIPAPMGPVLAFYPACDKLKTAEDTKTELKKAIQPSQMEVQVERVRKVGNAGVVVQTTTREAAEKLKNAVPPTLRVETPRSKPPQVSLRNVDADLSDEDIIEALVDQNFKGTTWTKDRLTKEAKLYKKRGLRGATTVIMECSPKLRQALVEKGRVYLGWQVVEVCDHISVTCCNRCQQYGHPERYCRTTEIVCGGCGEVGHRKPECKSESKCCATCKKFGKPADTHATASRECPARIFAEKRQVAMINYGTHSPPSST